MGQKHGRHRPSDAGPPVDGDARHFVADPNARFHVFIAEGFGARDVLSLFETAGHELKGRVVVIYAETTADSANYSAALADLPIAVLHAVPSMIAAVSRLGVLLASRIYSTRVYVAGSETMIDLVLQLAVASGMDAQTVMIGSPRMA